MRRWMAGLLALGLVTMASPALAACGSCGGDTAAECASKCGADCTCDKCAAKKADCATKACDKCEPGKPCEKCAAKKSECASKKEKCGKGKCLTSDSFADAGLSEDQQAKVDAILEQCKPAEGEEACSWETKKKVMTELGDVLTHNQFKTVMGDCGGKKKCGWKKGCKGKKSCGDGEKACAKDGKGCCKKSCDKGEVSEEAPAEAAE